MLVAQLFKELFFWSYYSNYFLSNIIYLIVAKKHVVTKMTILGQKVKYGVFLVTICLKLKTGKRNTGFHLVIGPDHIA